jgi:hypothetical protein
MFFKKENEGGVLVPVGTEEVVSCNDCACLVIKANSQNIIGGGYYCQGHRKPYSRIGYKYTDKGTEMVYFREAVCDKDGNIINIKNK